MDIESVGQKRSLLRFQSNFILPVARLTFLVGAAFATVAIIAGLTTALYFQLITMGEPELVPVPPQYSAPPPPIDLSQIDARLSPPGEIRLIVTLSEVDRTLTEDDVIGFFDASTPNGLTKYPDDFSILGGESTEFFHRVQRSNKQLRSALAPTTELIKHIESARKSLVNGKTKTESFSLKVVARDIHGSYSKPTDIEFKLSYGLPRPHRPQEQKSADPVPPPESQQLTALQQLSHEIAVTLDPGQTTHYFDFNRRASQIPVACGASENTPGFMSAYRQGFEHVREKLTPAVIEAFYAGLCNSWRNMLDKHATTRTAADAARNAALQKNRDIESEFNLGRAAGLAGRSVSLSTVVGAFSVFLVIALSLAILAGENHTKVMRDLAEATRALEATANRQKQQQAGTSENEASIT